MEYLIINRERSLDAVAKRIYKRLPLGMQAQAKEKLLKLNPALKHFENIEKGFIVIVPSLGDLENKAGKSAINPIEGLVGEVQDALNNLETLLNGKFSEASATQEADIAVLEAISKLIPSGETESKKEVKAISTALKKEMKAIAGLKRDTVKAGAKLKFSRFK